MWKAPRGCEVGLGEQEQDANAALSELDKGVFYCYVFKVDVLSYGDKLFGRCHSNGLGKLKAH